MRENQRFQAMLDAAILASRGLPASPPEPLNPTASEALLLRAIECFRSGRFCAAWDLYEEAEAAELAASRA